MVSPPNCNGKRTLATERRGRTLTVKLLVTGGAGFIGTNFVTRLLEWRPNWSAVVLDSLTEIKDGDEAHRIPADVELVIGDICDRELVHGLVQRCDAIVHFAAESHNDNSFLYPRRFVETNVVGTVELLDAARRYRKRFHHVSTDEVYGDLPLDGTEKFDLRTPYDPTSYYSASKAASDHFVRAAYRQFGVATTISNCSNNFGPLQHVEKFIPRQITNILMDVKPRLYGDGRNIRDWIHVDDHNSAVLQVIENGALGETYLIGADGERSNEGVLKEILRLMDRSSDWFDRVPDRPGNDRRYAIDATRLRDELSWTPYNIDFSEALKRTIEWYEANESWWMPRKMLAEARYRELGR